MVSWLISVLNTLGISFTLAVILTGTILISATAGFLSNFLVIQKQSVLGDALAHSSLPGVVLAFLLFQTKDIFTLMVFALVFGLLSSILINVITDVTPLKGDAAIAISLSFFFSIGVTLFSYVQQLQIASQAGLSEFIFGSLTYLTYSDLIQYLGYFILILFILFVYKQQFKTVLFDRELSKILGLNILWFDFLSYFIITLTVILGLQLIGIVLIAGLLVIPSIGARRWTDNYSKLFFISSLLSVIAGVTGVLISVVYRGVPPGPIIILSLTILTIISIIFGTRNGLLTDYLHVNLFHRRMNHDEKLTLLINSLKPEIQKSGLKVFEFNKGDFPEITDELLEALSDCGYCKMVSPEKCVLTYDGVKKTQTLITKGELTND